MINFRIPLVVGGPFVYIVWSDFCCVGSDLDVGLGDF